jgi:hypothetical protein
LASIVSSYACIEDPPRALCMVITIDNVRYASLARLRREVASTLALIEMSRMVVWLPETPYGYREAA